MNWDEESEKRSWIWAYLELDAVFTEEQELWACVDEM